MKPLIGALPVIYISNKLKKNMTSQLFIYVLFIKPLIAFLLIKTLHKLKYNMTVQLMYYIVVNRCKSHHIGIRNFLTKNVTILFFRLKMRQLLLVALTFDFFFLSTCQVFLIHILLFLSPILTLGTVLQPLPHSIHYLDLCIRNWGRQKAEHNALELS